MTADQLDALLERQRNSKVPLTRVLRELRLLSVEVLRLELAEYGGTD